MNTARTIRVLAISGSLRRASGNSALVAAAVQLAPEHVAISICSSLADLPHFNPDVEAIGEPEAVAAFRAILRDADGVLISSPEYAHGVPGALKNALDWVVGSGELIDKPIALINASGRATHAWASLAETLTVMSARVIPAASITIPLDGRAPDPNGIVGDPVLSSALRSAIEHLASAVRDTAGGNIPRPLGSG